MTSPVSKKWVIAPTIPPEIQKSLSDFNPFMQQFLFNRQVLTPEQAEAFLGTSGSLYDPLLMKNMSAAVNRILLAIHNHEKMVVYGDYDVDGVTATALLVQALREYGADVQGYIPNRFDEGYGLNIEALESIHSTGVSLVITVDCGIRSPNEVKFAHSKGLDIIITDHHEPKNDLPEAVAVICPKQVGDVYPEKDLAGVGLAYKLAEALNKEQPFTDAKLEDWLDLVAVGTVADVVPLTGENRTLVKAGIRQLHLGHRPGLISLAGAAGLSYPMISARDIGFALGPRLNAAGRLESALNAFDLLMAPDTSESGLLAQKLDDQNKYRQEMTRQMQETAEGLAHISRDDLLIFAASPEFNMGVVGLVAARLTEAYYLPSIVAAYGDDFTRASCRSIPEFHITKALDECADLFERHGGHAMAAGFTIRNDRLPELQDRLHKIADRELRGKNLQPVVYADMEIGFSDLKPDLLKYIEAMEPTGYSNREIMFVSRQLSVLRHRTVGSDQRHLRMTVSDGKITYDGIAFRLGHWAEQMPKKVDLLYAFEKNTFQGRETLQLNFRDIKTAG